MKYLLLFLALVPFNFLAMQSPEDGRAYKIFSEEDSNGDVWVSDGHGGRVKKTYDGFFFSLAETASEDDVHKQLKVAQPLFVQLCVQASKAKNIDPKPFQELLDKIKVREIETDQQTITMTQKDGSHRLLSYIPSTNRTARALVNGKKIRWISIVGRGRINYAEDAASSIPQFNADDPNPFPLDPACFAYPILEFPPYGHGKSSKGSDIQLARECELKANYDFTADQEHHAKIVAEFNELIKKN